MQELGPQHASVPHSRWLLASPGWLCAASSSGLEPWVAFL